MLSSSSVEKFYSDKKHKKKYQKFKNCQVNDNFTTTKKIEYENSRTVWRSEMSNEKNSDRFTNLKDFPELKTFKKHNNKSFFESNCNEKLTAAVTGIQKESIEVFPALKVTTNRKIDEINLVKSEGKFTQKISEEGTSALCKMLPKVGFEVRVNADISNTKRIKVSSSKKASVQPQKNIYKKKRTDPVLINFQDILALSKIQKKKKQHNTLTNKVQRHSEILSGNILDSSNPKRSRGKHREIKKKKLTTLKTNIIKERILKQKMKEISTDTDVANVCFNLINKIDFKSEITTYLNEYNEKKFKNLKNKNKIKENIEERSHGKENQENIETKSVEKKEENSENSLDAEQKKIPQVFLQGKIKFSSKFREYCDNVITHDLNSAVAELIKELVKLQDRLFSRDPIKGKIKKRHVSGIREVRKFLTLKKVKMIIIAPNLEKLQMEGSVYDSVNELKSVAKTQNVTYGFALDRYKLGRCTKKSVPISAFAILNYEGIENLYGKALQKLEEAKKKFSDLIGSEKIVENGEKKEDVNSQLISSLISAFREDLRLSEND